MDHLNQTEHQVIVELLPWFVKGTLNSEETFQVEQHLSVCNECQQEIALYQQLAQSVKVKKPNNTWQPSPAQFSKIIADVDEMEKITQATPKQVISKPFISKISAWFKATPNPVFWFMSLETMALAVLIVLVVGRTPQFPEEHVFETLSNEKPALTENLPRIQIVFSEDITELEIRALLESQQGQLVEGPSKLGVYTVQLAKKSPNDVQHAIDALRNNQKVKLVEGSRVKNKQ